MKNTITGVILAGGQNSRFSGKNKAFVHICGGKMIDRIFCLFRNLFDEIILVTNDPMQYLDYDCMVVTDLFPLRSSLTGLHAGLFYASKPYAFFSPCDTPFLKQEVVDLLTGAVDDVTDVIVPETPAGLEPLCAIYSKKCLQPVENQLCRGKLKIQGFFSQVRVKRIPEPMLLEKDPELLSFYNVNTPQDLAKAKAVEARVFNMK
jgi:molybdenum cofactor guanylyltransferase